MTGAVSSRIAVDEKPDASLRDEILKPLRAYNESHVGPIKAEQLAITLRDSSDAVTGGLWGVSVAGWMFVDLLVVPEEFRGQGLGSDVLARAEAIARNRGCIGIWLHTGTFQAPAFYEKQGYTSFGTIPDYPLGHDTVYFMKRLS